jgi:hypothetical protein
VAIDVGLTTKWTKFRDIRFFVELNFIQCGVGECTGEVEVFSVNDVVDGFSEQE